jgi:hypothetical protein
MAPRVSSVSKMPRRKQSRRAAAVALMPSPELVGRVAELEGQLHAERSERVDGNNLWPHITHIKEELKEMRATAKSDYQFLHSRMDTVQSNLTEKMDAQTLQLTAHMDQTWEKVGAKIEGLQNFRWAIRGGLAILALIATAVFGRLAIIFFNSPWMLRWIGVILPHYGG